MADQFVEASDALLDDIVLELDFLQPDEETLLRSKYSRVHPAVASAMARGASQRQILALLEQKGLELHHAKLTRLFKSELAARDENGERTCCLTCGQTLKPKDAERAKASICESSTPDSGNEVGE